MKLRSFSAARLLGLTLPLISTASALDLYWNPLPLDNTWDQVTPNWSSTSGGMANQLWAASGDNAIFDQAATYTVTLSGTQSAGTLSATAGDVTLAGTLAADKVTSSGIFIATGATLNTTAPRIQKLGITPIEVNGTLKLGTANFASSNFIQLSGNGTVFGGFRHSGTATFGGSINDPTLINRANFNWNGVDTSPGILTLSGNNNGMTGQIFMNNAGAVLKLASANALGLNAYLNLDGTNNPSMLVELAAANLTRAWAAGTAGNFGLGGILWGSSNSGFYATGADRSLTFTTDASGTTPTDVIWGLNGLTTSTVVLGAEAATHKITWTNNIDLNGLTRTFNVGNGMAEVDAALSGVLSNGGIAKTGAGVLALSGDNTFGSGTFNYGVEGLDSGAIRLVSATALGAYSSINLAGGSTTVRQIQLTGGNTYAYNLTLQGISNPTTTGAFLVSLSGDNIWNGTINMIFTGGGYGIRADAGSSLTLNGNLGGTISNPTARSWDFHGAGNIIVNGSIQNNSGVIVRVLKSGAGTLALNATNSYSSFTSVIEGTLKLNHAAAVGSSSRVDLAAGTLLDVSSLPGWTLGSGKGLNGNGSIAGVVTANGTVSPGLVAAEISTLTFQNDLTLNPSSAYSVEISEDGLTNDKLAVTGNLTGNGTINVTFSGALPFVPVAGSEFDVADAASIGGTPTVTGTLPAGLAWDNSLFTTSGKIKVVAAASSPFQTWATEAGLTGDDALPSADPDKDGVSNLIEFALNGNPKNGSNRGLSASVLQDASAPAGRELTLVVAVRDGAIFSLGSNGVQTTPVAVNGLIYTVEGSLNLAFPNSEVGESGTASDTAPAASGLPSLAGTAWEYRTFKLNASEGLAGKGFLRLLVQAP